MFERIDDDDNDKKDTQIIDNIITIDDNNHENNNSDKEKKDKLEIPKQNIKIKVVFGVRIKFIFFIIILSIFIMSFNKSYKKIKISEKDKTDLINKERTDKDLTITTREYILGAMIAEIESEIITPDVKPCEKNYRILVGATLLMLVNGESMENVKAKLGEVVIDGKGSLSQLLNDEENSIYAKVAKNILSMWKARDMRISIDDQTPDSVALTGLIKLILTMDTILPEEGLLDSSMNVSLDGIKGILAAA